MLEYPHSLLHNLSVIMALTAMVIMVYGVIVAVIKLVYSELRRKERFICYDDREELRVNLGSYILLALEILIVADVIESISNRTYEDLIILAGIVVIRTMMGYFLDKELASHIKHKK
ncbi:MAG: DUF1622 domain-containing protein [Erysipelotrichaceae bacterium]|nr:DUF1622 domain-containing protein [Erysipelotrichaceae bacterium]